MTHFLAVGFIRDALQEVLQQSSQLVTLSTMSEAERQQHSRARAAGGSALSSQAEVQQVAEELRESVQALLATLDRFESEPVIYTGPGDTASVLAMLEGLIEAEPASDDE